jgi:hypothetical protein
MTGQPVPAEPTGGPGGPSGQQPGSDLVRPRHARLVGLWALVLDRFRDYLHWTMDMASDPSTEPGGAHDPDA